MRDSSGPPVPTGWHDNFPACPPWCTRVHDDGDNVELAEGIREHARELDALDLADGGGVACVELVRVDELGTPGDNRVAVDVDDLTTPAEARRIAAAMVYGATVAEGQVAA